MPVVTADIGDLPYTMDGNTKVFHLIAEVVKQQIVICSVRAIRPAHTVGGRCPVRGNHGCGEYQEQDETTEKEEFQTRTTVPAKSNLSSGPRLDKTTKPARAIN